MKLNYCTECAAPLEKRNSTEYQCSNGHKYFNNPHEEMGIHIAPEHLELIDCSLNQYQDNDTSCDFAFLCREWEGEISANDDVAAVEWKPIEFLKSPEFAWPYPYLYNKLQKLATNHELSRS